MSPQILSRRGAGASRRVGFIGSAALFCMARVLTLMASEGPATHGSVRAGSARAVADAAAAEEAAAYLTARGASISTLADERDAGSSPRRARLAVYITDLCSRSPYGSPWTGRDEDLARLVDVPNVEDITFDRQFARPSAFAFLPKMKSLRALYFTLGCVVTDELVRIISQCRGIERVVVLVGDVSDDGAAQLAKVGSLQALRMLSTRTTDKGVAALSALADLEELGLPHAKITDAAIPHIANLSKLRELDITGTPITDKGLGALVRLSTLRKLDIGSTAITDKGLGGLAELNELRKLDISSTRVTDKGVPSLAKLQSLEELDVHGTGVTEAGLRLLRNSLPRCKIVFSADDGVFGDHGRGEQRGNQQKGRGNGTGPVLER